MNVDVPAEDLKVGDRLEHSTRYGNEVLSLIAVEPRVHGIKFTGVSRAGQKVFFGMKYGQTARRVSP